ncbi:MAG: FKBP-type peptidyl-prolyl cis-trans isomerase [Planctomycetes bacterium]|nr:FKBP-type peptidyl-prolyl cis-trans isomerase [Planctomycetota bacterium]
MRAEICVWPIVAVVLGGGIVRADDEELSRIPPDYVQLAVRLADAKTSLPAAIVAAERRINGQARSAETRLENGRLEAVITVVAPDVTAEVTVDLAKGDMGAPAAQSDAPLLAALAAAEQAGGGKAIRATPDADHADQIVVEVVAAQARKELTIHVPGGKVVASRELSLVRFPGAAVSGEPIETASGLMYYDLEAGQGPSPVNLNDKVKVHYTTWLMNGKELDSSYKQGPAVFLPLNQFIPGWMEGLRTMKAGGRRKLIVPAALAHGPKAHGAIPAGAMLLFDVHLLDVSEARPQTQPAPGASGLPTVQPTSRPAMPGAKKPSGG